MPYMETIADDPDVTNVLILLNPDYAKKQMIVLEKDSEICKKADVDCKPFSNIRNNPDCRPSKTVAIAFAIAQELDLEKTKGFTACAGMAINHRNKFDIIIEYFIKQKNYDVFVINEALSVFEKGILSA